MFLTRIARVSFMLAVSAIVSGALVGCPPGPSLIPTPDIVGQTEAAAVASLTDAGLTVGAMTEQYSTTVPAGRVISQYPAAGADVNPGSAVDFVLSRGPRMAAVPDVVGQTKANAVSAVEAAGLVVGIVTDKYDPAVPVGRVIAQKPAGNTVALLGAAVNLAVSLGPEFVAVPDVVGKTQETAVAMIDAAKLQVGIITEKYDPDVPAGRVIAVKPVAGTQVEANSYVNLAVSLGPAPVTVPNVVGMARANAENAIVNAGLVVGEVTE